MPASEMPVRNYRRKWVLEALQQATALFPFPMIGVDSDNGYE